MARTRMHVLSFVLLLSVVPQISFGMSGSRSRSLVTAFVTEIDGKTALLAGVGTAGVGCLLYRLLMPTKIDHDHEVRVAWENIAQAREMERAIAEAYFPLINCRILFSFSSDQQDVQLGQGRKEEGVSSVDLENPAPPPYERLYPDTAIPILDGDINQQVTLGNVGDPRVAVQFPFTAFQQKLTKDVQVVTERITALEQLEDRCHTNFQDFVTRHTNANPQDAHTLYGPIYAEIKVTRTLLSQLHRKLFLVNRRMPFLSGTKDEYPHFEAWETERKRITDLQRLEQRMNGFENRVADQNTRIGNLELSAFAARHGLETTRDAIEMLHKTHHPDCQDDCTANMKSITEYFAPVAQFLNSFFGQR